MTFMFKNNMADARGPRLLADLNSVFKRDPSIDEYDVLPVLEPKHNRSPFILQEHKLGVEAWAVKVLLKYSANRLTGWRGREPSEKFIDPIEVCQLSRAVLLFNPDNYTAWNIRKELIENGYLTIPDDLSFGALILTKHPKSPETFIHRRWLFQQLLDHCLSSSSGSNASCSAAAAANEDIFVSMEAIDVDVSASPEPGMRMNGAFSLETSRLLRSHTQRELEVSEQAAGRYPCNYHAWSHRIWVVQHCLNCSIQVLLSELKTTEQWTSRHISDHSGFHYRQFLLKELHARRDRLMSSYSLNSAELYLHEMSFICDLIQSFPGHEALWYHRKYLFQAMLDAEFMERKAKLHFQPSNGHVLMDENRECGDLKTFRSAIISQEIDSVKSKEAQVSQKYNQDLVQNYLKWLHTL